MDGVITVRPAVREKRYSLFSIRRQWLLYVLLAPAILWIVVFNFIPTLITIPMVFKDYNIMKGIWGSPWNGMENMRAAWESPDFLRVLRNTLEISLLRLSAGFFPPIILAVLTHELRSARIRNVAQSVTYLPHFLSWPIVWGIVLALLNPADGVLVTALRQLGIKPVDVFLEQVWFRPLLIVSGIWKEIGWGTIIYLAALSGIEPELYEAATVDGAEWYQRLWHITLPGIKPVMVLLLTLSVSGLLNAGFEQVYLFYSPLNYQVSDIIDTWVFRKGLLGANYALGTAVGFWKSVVGLILILTANKAAKQFAGQGIW